MRDVIVGADPSNREARLRRAGSPYEGNASELNRSSAPLIELPLGGARGEGLQGPSRAQLQLWLKQTSIGLPAGRVKPRAVQALAETVSVALSYVPVQLGMGGALLGG